MNPTLADVQSVEAQSLLPTYSRIPLLLERGKGPYVFAADGRRYLDFLTGIGANGATELQPPLVSGDQKRIYVTCNYCIQMQQYNPSNGQISNFGPALPVTGGGWYSVLRTDGPLDLGNQDLTTTPGATVLGAGLTTTPPTGCGSIQYQVVTPPTNGTVVSTTTGFSYTPASGYAGRDRFSIRATDPGCTVLDNPDQPLGRVASVGSRPHGTACRLPVGTTTSRR